MSWDAHNWWESLWQVKFAEEQREEAWMAAHMHAWLALQFAPNPCMWPIPIRGLQRLLTQVPTLLRLSWLKVVCYAPLVLPHLRYYHPRKAPQNWATCRRQHANLTWWHRAVHPNIWLQVTGISKLGSGLAFNLVESALNKVGNLPNKVRAFLNKVRRGLTCSP